jgi:malonyl-ACP decarboxylase
VVITGLGFHGALASSARGFCEALRAGRSAIGWMELERPRRKLPAALCTAPEISAPAARRVLRETSVALQASCAAALEALHAAGWSGDDCAIVAGGSNLQQRSAAEAYRRFLEQPEYVNPRYAATYLDSTLVAAVSALASLRGIGFTAGGGMASGNVALFNGWTLVRSGAARACLCIGAMTELSELEIGAFANLGALAVPEPASDPARASRPFDAESLGFVCGEAAGAVLLEDAESASARGAAPLAELAGAAIVLDGNAGTEASAEGEARAMRAALEAANIAPEDIDYVNAHGTGTPSGDRVECEAIREAVGTRAVINSTKALTAHTISAAGVVELIATIIQMRERFVHANPHLETPIDEALRFAGRVMQPLDIHAALSNSFSIGGINTAVALRRA